MLATLSRRGPNLRELARADEVAKSPPSGTRDPGRGLGGTAGFPSASKRGRAGAGERADHAAVARVMPKGRNFQ